jgi:hypothetical protein
MLFQRIDTWIHLGALHLDAEFAIPIGLGHENARQGWPGRVAGRVAHSLLAQ